MFQEEAYAVFRNTAVDAEGDGDVQAVDHIVAQGGRDAADRWFPGMVRVVADRADQLGRGQGGRVLAGPPSRPG
ncbi:hypothetical protein GCM10010176_066000 [Nonomuraea spiralis]|nr:hypothetical protein GCM10010176_066000 [Nonomuraea spiralis]